MLRDDTRPFGQGLVDLKQTRRRQHARTKLCEPRKESSNSSVFSYSGVQFEFWVGGLSLRENRIYRGRGNLCIGGGGVAGSDVAAARICVESAGPGDTAGGAIALPALVVAGPASQGGRIDDWANCFAALCKRCRVAGTGAASA